MFYWQSSPPAPKKPSLLPTSITPTIASGLEKISGIGAVTRKKLIKAFGSMAGVKNATASEISKIVGEKLSEKIKDSF